MGKIAELFDIGVERDRIAFSNKNTVSQPTRIDMKVSMGIYELIEMFEQLKTRELGESETGAGAENELIETALVLLNRLKLLGNDTKNRNQVILEIEEYLTTDMLEQNQDMNNSIIEKIYEFNEAKIKKTTKKSVGEIIYLNGENKQGK